VSSRGLEALERILSGGGEPDDVLRSVVRLLAEEPAIGWAGVAFLEKNELALGPQAGEANEAHRQRFPIVYKGSPVGELWVDGDPKADFLSHVADLLSAHVLIGWDTRGERWEP
jgi:hypothetical protein